MTRRRPLPIANLLAGTPAPSRLAIRELVAASELDRIAARAVWLVSQGRLEARDLRQLLPLPRIRSDRTIDAAEASRAVPLPERSAIGSWILGPAVAKNGRSIVYRARHRIHGWLGAVKVGSPGSEAKILAAISHRNVIRVWDAGEDFVVTAWASRGSIARRLHRRGRFRAGTAVKIARAACAGLQAAWESGFVHGDVKPDNLLIDSAGTVKLADFGLARRHDAPAPIDRVNGSWAYLAPECFHGTGDHRADIYALGLTLHQMLSGHPAVTARTFRDARKAHHALAREPLHWTVPGVSRGLSQLIQRLTARHPEDRPGDYRAIRAELLEWEKQV